MKRSRRLARGRLFDKLRKEGMKLEEVAKKYGVSKMTVQRQIKEANRDDPKLRSDGQAYRKDDGQEKRSLRGQLHKKWPYLASSVSEWDPDELVRLRIRDVTDSRQVVSDSD